METYVIEHWRSTGRQMLHVDGCTAMHHRTAKLPLSRSDWFLSGNFTWGERNYLPAEQCPHCHLPQRRAEARAQVWALWMHSAHVNLERERAEARRWEMARVARLADELEWLHKYLPLRDQIVAAWGEPDPEAREQRKAEVSAITSYPAFDRPVHRLLVKLTNDWWWDCGTIEATPTEDGRLEVTHMNYSSGAIMTPRDAHGLSGVIGAIENWRNSDVA